MEKIKSASLTRSFSEDFKPIFSLLALEIISSFVSLSCNLISNACTCLFLRSPHPEIIADAASPKPINAMEQISISIDLAKSFQ